MGALWLNFVHMTMHRNQLPPNLDALNKFWLNMRSINGSLENPYTFIWMYLPYMYKAHEN